ncbi:transmembrane protein 179B [Morone saxatilis]|uniref:transmembrane protein 179B n=1 Tax=Morone saxatilis TaxID=34816 RepID=UPI0015E1E18C|nr:transmembrane protein 179B [Morone saxatilis]
MALTGLLLLELALYASCFVCGIVTAASLTIVQGNFGGRCMLYGLVNFNATASLIGVQSSSSSSLCYFVSAISIMVAVVCFSLSLYWLYTFCIDGDVKRERMWMNLMVAVCGTFLFFLLITGCMLKRSEVARAPGIPCEEAQTRKWASPIKGGKFYNSLFKAETAVWVNFFSWLIIGGLVFIQRRQSSGTKPIVGGFGGPAGGLFGDPGVTAAETEPFFNRPARPQ